ncbi:hypothetical protein QNO07_26410 [Streptomyces sp. 549]|uniref:hypothetical protein n=1 Tax=Streptomyces sp. 549 TaxID=3049076 RepID=UPI0024C2EF3B|nr:hypothetical protein [Streptomyces sp. 549]MDK1476891.1 hypothetical protein [Streptomyces sp. 549]
MAGVEAALVLDAHFRRASAPPGELADAFHGLHVPIHHNRHIAAAAERADRDEVRRAGRWLVRNGVDRCSVTVGLALVAAVATTDDIPLIQTIGLLSRRFGPLAAHALERLPGRTEALLWLADRVTGWGRVHVVEALCRLDDPAARPWLLRRACDDDYLNRYFAGTVAVAAGLHEAVRDLASDHEFIEHTGRLLLMMSDCEGTGATLAHYPHSAMVWEAHSGQVRLLSPSVEGFVTLAMLAQFLTTASPEAAGCTAEQRRALRAAYVSLLDREDWADAARAGLAARDRRMRWLVDFRAPELRLRALPG